MDRMALGNTRAIAPALAPGIPMMDVNDADSGGAGWERMKGTLPLPLDSSEASDLLWREFSAQFRWYDRAASRNRKAHQILKFLALGAGAAVTVLAALGAAAAITASAGAAVVIIEGVQEIGKFHANWINYRATAERLRQHGFFYAAGVEPYSDPHTRRERLAQVMRQTVAKESGTWTETARRAAREGDA